MCWWEKVLETIGNGGAWVEVDAAAWCPSFRQRWSQSARHHVQLHASRAFLWSKVQPVSSSPPSPLLSSPCRLSPLISASHDLTIFPFMFFLRWYESLFHESNSSFMFQLRKQRVKEKEKKKTRPLGRFLLELTPAAVCKCRQTYLGFTQWRLLPSMKTCSIVPFKGLCMAKRGGGCIKIKRTKRGRCGWPHTVTDSVISSEIPPPPHLLPPHLPSLSLSLCCGLAAACLISLSIQQALF